MRRIALPILSLLLLPLFSLHAAGEVDLLWQGETYTPPFYKGRALWGTQARIVFTAIPNLPNTDPASLYYRWSKNGTVLGSLSGFNKRSLTISDTILSLPVEIKVDLRDGEEGKVLGSSSVTLSPISAFLLVVEDNPLYGLLLNKTIGATFALEEQEVSFAALPLYAPVTSRNVPALVYAWNTSAGDARTGNKVTYRVPENSSGTSAITLRVTNTRVLIPPLEKSFLIEFGNQPGI
ncbi:hypothetical protein KW796_02455 [Candidatus Parcubacteria bacterium]|nr:hypothetical protein [Candidatus Parcubacteria bacterium]